MPAVRKWAQQFHSFSTRLRWLQTKMYGMKHEDPAFEELYNLLVQVKDKALDVYGPRIASEMYWETEPK